jgi:hypothetical protein
MTILILMLLYSGNANPNVVWDSFKTGMAQSLRNKVFAAPPPRQVYASSRTMAPDEAGPPVVAPWRALNASVSSECTGLLRYGSNSSHIFSLPVVTNTSVSCSLGSIQEYIWSNPFPAETAAQPTCECRPHIPLRMTLRGRCLAIPQSGWVSPGLVDCVEGESMVGEWKYNPVSGQIRSGGKCLTAFPYNSKDSSSWHPWGIQVSDCLSYHNPSKRQSWSVPPGVGTVLQNPFDSLHNVSRNLSIPSGYIGRVHLRDSWDIGSRCLDIALSPPSIPTTIQVVFVEAVLCEDSRLRQTDFGLWQFWVGKNTTSDSMKSAGEFRTCPSGICTTCNADDEYRAVWLGDDGQRVAMDTVSIPAGQNVTECDISTLKQVAVSESLSTLTNGTCFCQDMPGLNHFDITNHPGSVLWQGVDDLPSTVDPAVVRANITSNTTAT